MLGLRKLLPFALLCLAAAAVGCAADREDLEGELDEDGVGATDAEEQSILGATATCEQPAVGKVRSSKGSCTATLVAPNVILAAAHCFEGPLVQEDAQGGLGTFEVNAGCDGAFRVKLTKVRRWGDFGSFFIRTHNDLAVAQLQRDIPASVAKPLGIADRDPSNGDPLTWYGYGRRTQSVCFFNPESDGKKAVYRGLRFPDRPFRACPGDSGGPLIGSNGKIIRVVSHGVLWGNLVQHSRSVIDQVDAWSR